jgi:UDP-N-acetylglucosamine--N-acetylmuramyl-(pentapeptide) pyrophosphoryl-undecaprenol N-acetylglucosamine transferase
MKVILAGGGTGGHLYPGIAVAERLVRENIEPFFLVSNRGIEARVLTGLRYNYIEQDMLPFMGKGVFSKAGAMLKLLPSANAISKYINKNDKILLLGGFASAPAALAGLMNGCDIYIHEQNSVMGLVNKMMSSHARRIFLSYAKTVGAPGRSTLVGNPVRKSLCNGRVKQESGKNLLILGGSGGSRIINNTMVAAAEGLLKAGYTIFHQTGEKMYDETMDAYGKLVNNKALQVEPYIDDMEKAYKESDLVIARSGSGTVFETMYARRPALYIPFELSAKNHQYMNALQVKEQGYAEILEEKDLNIDSLTTAVNAIFAQLSKYNNRLGEVVVKDSVELILKGMDVI